MLTRQALFVPQHEPVISDDFSPTILHIAGIKNADIYNKDIDGKDLTPLLKQTNDFVREKPLIWHYPHYWGWEELREADATIKPFSAIRDGDWKLIYGYENGQVEADPSVLNLTSFETFFEEKRPFFLEGNEIFDYEVDGDIPYYSRRIGSAPSFPETYHSWEISEIPISVLCNSDQTWYSGGSINWGPHYM